MPTLRSVTKWLNGPKQKKIRGIKRETGLILCKFWKLLDKQCVKSVQIRSNFWSVFSRIWTEYGEIRSFSPYSVRMRENTDQKLLRIWMLFTQWKKPLNISFSSNKFRVNIYRLLKALKVLWMLICEYLNIVGILILMCIGYKKCTQPRLNLSWRWSLSYRNQSIDLQSKWIDWFLCDRNLRFERVKE